MIFCDRFPSRKSIHGRPGAIDQPDFFSLAEINHGTVYPRIGAAGQIRRWSREGAWNDGGTMNDRIEPGQ